MNFTNYLSTCSGFEYTLIFIAIFSGIIFLAMFVANLFGINSDHDTDGDSLDHNFTWFTYTNLVKLLLVTSLSTLQFHNIGFSQGISLLLGTICGVLTIVVLVLTMYGMRKFRQDGTPDINTLIGRVGTVYLKIPENSKGKIKIDFGGSVKILDAISNCGTIETGRSVTVYEINDGNIIVTYQ
ncbi:MAG: NfeD family protein [Candidatus Pacearchaeota archaeon]|jgi:membrane protein implicated in regulation of membrane protease activity|nr:NfeD family protein [Clostridia bacterium]